MELHPPFTNVQRELLELFALDVPETDLREIMLLLARYFVAKATEGMDRLAVQDGLTPDDFRSSAHGNELAGLDSQS